MTMKLHISAASSYSRKIRVMLIEKGVVHDVETVNLWEPNDLKQTNPIGKVPALKLDDGRVLISSPLIADYVDSLFPEPRFIPADPDGRLEVRRWEALADGAMDAVSASLYEMRFHDEVRRSHEWLARQRGKFEAGFAALEDMLGGRAWCVGDTPSLADIALACHIGFIVSRRPQFFPQEKYPGLTRLWKKLETRESFRQTAPPPA
jgi:glutathione S-transferase